MHECDLETFGRRFERESYLPGVRHCPKSARDAIKLPCKRPAALTDKSLEITEKEDGKLTNSRNLEIEVHQVLALHIARIALHVPTYYLSPWPRAIVSVPNRR